MGDKERIMLCLDRAESEIWNAICEYDKNILEKINKDVFEITLTNCKNLMKDLKNWIRKGE